MPIEFKEGGSGYSLGVEEELHIVDATTGELVQKIEEIMSRLPDELHEFVSYELFQSVMEIKTAPCASVAEVEKQLRGLRSRVGSWAAALAPPAGGDLRPARARGPPGRGGGDRPPKPPLRADAAPFGALGQLSFLAGFRYGLRVGAGEDLRDLPARRPPPRFPRLRGIRGLRGPDGRVGCDGGLHLLLVGRAPAPRDRDHRA